MAGIGFELKKIYGRQTLASNLSGTLYATMVTVGPALLSASLTIILKVLMDLTGTATLESRFWAGASTWVFIAAALVAFLFSAPVSRYISDCIFLEKEEDICPSAFGLLILSTLVGAVIMLLLCIGVWFSDYHAPLAFLVAYYFQGVLIIGSFSLMTYASAMNQYRSLAYSFLVGWAVAIALYLVFVLLLGMDRLIATGIGLAACFFIVDFTLIFQCVRAFGVPKGHYFAFLRYFRLYPRLTICGIAYTFGLYLPILIYWFCTPEGEIISIFKTWTEFDMSLFLAIIVNMPAMVIFVVKVETAFYEKYTGYVSALNNGTLPMIIREREIMTKSLHQQLFFVYEIQLIITLVLACFLSVVLPYWGASTFMVHLFVMLCLSVYTVFCMYFTIIVFYYFSDYSSACISAVVFFIVTGICCFIAAFLRDFWAFPLFIGGVTGWIVAFLLLRRRMNNLDSFLMCK